MTHTTHHYCTPDCNAHCFICGKMKGFPHDEFKHHMYAIEQRANERKEA